MCDNERKDQEDNEDSTLPTEDTLSECSASPSNTDNTREIAEVAEVQPTRTEIKINTTLIQIPAGQLETQVVGDDFSKRNDQNILCECQPNVTGAAVPALSSINNLASNSFDASDKNTACIQEPEELKSSEFPSTSKTSKKPSMIPKLTRPNCTNRPARDKGHTDLLKKSAHHLHPIPPRDKPHRSKIEGQNIGVQLGDKPSSKISSRMLNLQERLKATTTMLRQRFEEDKTKTDSSCQISSACSLAKKESVGSQTSEYETASVAELFKVISQLKNTATTLSSIHNFRKQKSYIEKLLAKITEIQKIAEQLTNFENKENEAVTDGDKELTEKETNKAAKTRDNKIYIKFLPKKDNKNDTTKKKAPNTTKDNAEGVQTEVALGSKLTSESLNSDADIPSKTPNEINMKDSDSMDGIFIPSCEPPINIDEEEEETNGLDITITFPEINNLLSQQDTSHLSVRLSDISEEALKKLKRCPKDFTLRMDFVQGKILFQTGKAPVNNFSIGPDLKFVENPVDERKSDIISIKPSTECSFASQLIPVENITKEITSYKSLRSTDSELFSVVNLPFIYRNPSLNTTTKSCITFKNDGILSMALLARHFGRSMPQIPSLTNIFEEKIMENLNRATALQIQERRRKNRASQRRGIITSNTV